MIKILPLLVAFLGLSFVSAHAEQKDCDKQKGHCKKCQSVAIQHGGLKISKAMMRSIKIKSVPTAAYITIENTGEEADSLLGVFSDIADKTEIHTTKVNEKGVMTMRPLEKIVIPAGKAIQLAPKQDHIMLFGLTETPMEGQYIPLRLDFEKAGSRMISFKVRDKIGTCNKHN